MCERLINAVLLLVDGLDLGQAASSPSLVRAPADLYLLVCFTPRSNGLDTRRLLGHSSADQDVAPVPHKDFSDLYEKMSGGGESAVLSPDAKEHPYNAKCHNWVPAPYNIYAIYT